MSSLLREEMDRVLFRPEGQKLVEFIEIEELQQGRHFLCVSSKEIPLILCIIIWVGMRWTIFYQGWDTEETKKRKEKKVWSSGAKIKYCLWRSKNCKIYEFVWWRGIIKNRTNVCLVSKEKEAQISVVLCRRVKHSRTKKLQHYGLEDSYERTEIWALEDLLILDGRDPDVVSWVQHSSPSYLWLYLLYNCLKNILYS